MFPCGSAALGPLDQSFVQAALRAQPALQAGHPAVIVVVIIPKQM